MEMSEIYNGSQWAHDIFLVNKARATEYITGRSSTLVLFTPSDKRHAALLECLTRLGSIPKSIVNGDFPLLHVIGGNKPITNSA